MDHAPRLVNVFPHPANVQCAVFSPDEKQIATACEDGFVRIWAVAQSDKPIAEYRQAEPARWLSYTRDGRRLVVVTASTLLRFTPPASLSVLDPSTGTPAFPSLTNLAAWVVSPDGQWLAVSPGVVENDDYAVRIHELATGRLVGRASGHEGFVVGINFSPDSRQIITAGRDHTARRWEIPSGQPLGLVLQHDSAVSRAVFSPDGQRLATATFANGPGQRNSFQLWDAATGAALGKPTEAMLGLYALGFDRRGRRLLAGDQQYALQVRDASTGEAQPSLKLPSYACSLAGSPADDRIAVGTDNGHVSLWDAEIGRSMGPPLFHSARVESVQFGQTGQRLLTASGDGTVKLWSLTPPRPALTLRLDGEWPKMDPGSIRTSFAREAGPMQIPLMDGTVRLIDPESLREVHRLVPSHTNEPAYLCDAAPDGHHWQVYGPGVSDLFTENADGTIQRVALDPPDGGGLFSPDSRRLFTIGRDRTIHLWSTTDGRLERTIHVPEPFAGAVYTSLDTQLALLAQDNGLHQWFDLASQTLLGAPFRLPSVWGKELDPTGQRLAITGKDQTVRVWKVGTGEPVSPVFKHAGTGINLDWSADGRRLVTAGTSPDARIWDAATGEQLLSPLTLSSEPMRAARWSSDGRFIVARSDDQLVRVWDAATAEPVTPKLRQESYVRFAGLLPNGRLLIATDPNTLQACDFAETRLAPDVLADYARLISGRRLSANGTLLPLKPDELAALRRSLAERALELFP
jgi:WD40 repeat protein